MLKKILLASLLAAPALLTLAQRTDGGISPQLLEKIKSSQSATPADAALRNALAGAAINQLATNPSNPDATDTYFSHEVPSAGVTDQKSSGRCWLFTGMNVMRARMIKDYNLGAFQFSQSYTFFYDQLEKANLFLQSVIDLANRPMDDKTVEWLFKNPLSDGGTFCGVADAVMKYGLVPAEVMPESYQANNTSRLSSLIALKLREYGLTLRQAVARGEKAKQIAERKQQMLATVYHMLSLTLGEPPVKFEWTQKDAQGRPVSTATYTPQEFYNKFVGVDLKNNYVMLMNDPSRPYNKVYEIDMDRHTYDGHNWLYLNLSIDDLSRIAIASLQDSTQMYFSCDVGKYLDKNTGLLDADNFDYESLLGTTFGMDKRQRIQTHDSGSSHAMTLMAVDLDSEGRPLKWKVENSWGISYGHQGYLIMTRKWFEDYMFRVVVNKKYVPQDILRLTEQKPVRLPAWDPMFQMED